MLSQTLFAAGKQPNLTCVDFLSSSEMLSSGVDCHNLGACQHIVKQHKVEQGPQPDLSVVYVIVGILLILCSRQLIGRDFVNIRRGAWWNQAAGKLQLP